MYIIFPAHCSAEHDPVSGWGSYRRLQFRTEFLFGLDLEKDSTGSDIDIKTAFITAVKCLIRFFFGHKTDWMKYLHSTTRLGSDRITQLKYWIGLELQKSLIRSTLQRSSSERGVLDPDLVVRPTATDQDWIGLHQDRRQSWLDQDRIGMRKHLWFKCDYSNHTKNFKWCLFCCWCYFAIRSVATFVQIRDEWSHIFQTATPLLFLDLRLLVPLQKC